QEHAERTRVGAEGVVHLHRRALVYPGAGTRKHFFLALPGQRARRPRGTHAGLRAPGGLRAAGNVSTSVSLLPVCPCDTAPQVSGSPRLLPGSRRDPPSPAAAPSRSPLKNQHFSSACGVQQVACAASVGGDSTASHPAVHGPHPTPPSVVASSARPSRERRRPRRKHHPQTLWRENDRDERSLGPACDADSAAAAPGDE